jgi:hypothetical protein
VETAEGIKEYNLPYPPHVQQPLLETIVKELRGEGKCPSTGETGARSNWIMEYDYKKVKLLSPLRLNFINRRDTQRFTEFR